MRLREARMNDLVPLCCGLGDRYGSEARRHIDRHRCSRYPQEQQSESTITKAFLWQCKTQRWRLKELP